MRINNLTIGYSIPSASLQSFANGSLKKIRFYASFQNLLTITNYSGYDPEIGARTLNNLVQGIDYGQYPQPRTMMGGIQIGF
jgi:TonB-dependent starch-binding outer membrane protein SusC